MRKVTQVKKTGNVLYFSSSKRLSGAMFCGSLSPRHCAPTGCRWRGRPTYMEGSCECI